MIFAAHPVPARDAILLSCLALSGGLIQSGLALLLWPLRRYAPERRALGRLYLHLSEMARSPILSENTPLGSDQVNRAQQDLSDLEWGQGYERWRYRSLLSQAERIRISLFTLSRFREKEFTEAVSLALNQIGKSLLNPRALPDSAGPLHEVERLAEKIRQEESTDSPLLSALGAFTGQLRAADSLARNMAPEGNSEFFEEEAKRAWWLRFAGIPATLRANLNIDSSGFRHAIRLAVCIGLAEILSRSVSLSRSYWLPITIAVVLRPEFASTYTRALLRIGGTIAGLLLATALSYALSPSIAADVALVSCFVFLLRWLGPANYGIFTLALSGLIVLLLAITGASPGEIVVARAFNTILGGSLALLAYLIWPTWEIRQLPETMAKLLESYGRYSRSVFEVNLNDTRPIDTHLDRLRLESRLARSNFNASVERLSAEPGTSERLREILSGLQSNSNRFAYAAMAVESGGKQPLTPPGMQSLLEFTRALDDTFSLLTQALRTRKLPERPFPDLRKWCDDFARAEGALPDRRPVLHAEADRMSNSLNTLKELLIDWIRAY